jgi:transcriptional regulator with XRE-family HTH domain
VASAEPHAAGITVNLNKHLSALRKRQKKTKAEIAKAVGCSPPYINDIENGNRSPSLKSCSKWARALGVPTSEIVQLLFQDQLAKAGLQKVLRIQVEPVAEPPQLDELEWDAVNEMVHSGWKQADAISEVIKNRDPSDTEGGS